MFTLLDMAGELRREAEKEELKSTENEAVVARVPI
jgi:hypothetical protein